MISRDLGTEIENVGLSVSGQPVKNLLLVAAIATLSAHPATAAPLCDYVSYMVKDGQCVDISDGSWRGAYNRYVDDVTAQNEPLIVQNLKSRSNTSSDGKTFFYATITGQFVNRSRRTITGGSATIAIYREDRLVGTAEVAVYQRIPPGGTASFETTASRSGGRLVAEGVREGF